LQSEVNGYQSQRDTLQPQVDQLSQAVTERGQELSQMEQRIADAVQQADNAANFGRFTVSGEGAAQGLTLTLNEDGSFSLENRGGRTVSGDYTLDDQQLVLSNANGDLGSATFPMTCPIARNDNGFAINQAEGCALAGLQFERGN